MKKVVSAFLCIMLVAAASANVLAHGHRYRYNPANTAANTAAYSVCGIEGCGLTGLHTHNNRTYAAHYYGDGHEYHGYCDFEDCTLSGYHAHDGVYSFGHRLNDGHDYHGYCAVANCELIGYHEHNGSYCFAHTANDGHIYHNARGFHH